MLTVRCTAKLLDRLKARPEPPLPASTTRLGDWYANYLPTRPAHMILLVNESTRLAALLPAKEISTLARRIPDAIAAVLQRLGAPSTVIDAERAAMSEVAYARTANRSVLGTMNDYVAMIQAGERIESESALDIAMLLNRTPVSPLVYERPDDVTRRILGVVSGPLQRSVAPDGRPVPPSIEAPVLALRVSLRGIEPEIWRAFRARSSLTLFEFHGALQTIMGWTDSHLHQFRTREKVYGPPDPEFPERSSEKRTLLGDVLRSAGDRLVYEYDFGDGWKHDVVLEQVLEPGPTGRLPHVTSGQRTCPPEDCGGPWGYEHLLGVLANPRHPEHRDLLQWLGGSFDPEQFDNGAINAALHGGGSDTKARRRAGGEKQRST